MLWPELITEGEPVRAVDALIVSEHTEQALHETVSDVAT